MKKKRERDRRRQITVVLTEEGFDIYQKMKGTYKIGALISRLLEKWYKEIQGGENDKNDR